MTGPTRNPGRLYHLLALYSALDTAVIESGDPEIAATVERFLPGTTGPDQRGWSRNLAEFLGGDLPDVSTSLRAITEAPQPSAPLLSRLVYILGAIDRLPSRQVDHDDLLSQALGLAAPQERGDVLRDALREEAVPGKAREEAGATLLGVLRERFNQRQDWADAVAYAVRQGCLDAIVASVPLCNPCLSMQGGVQCVVVDTYFEHPTLTVDQVTAILDPRNWDETAGELFCKMTDLGPCGPPNTGWGRVLETVGAWCGSGLPVLVTDLRYHKAYYPAQHKAVLQYDLDDPFPGAGDGQVTVDKGWLTVTRGTAADPTAGVSVATRKVVHIRPLVPVAQKVFVCAAGYGQAAMEMLFGGAQHPPKNAVPWSSPPGPAVPPPGGQGGGQSAGAPTTPAGLAVSMFSDYLTDVAKESSDIFARYVGNQLTADDLAAFGAKIGARLASDPWRFLQKLAELPPPKPGGGAGTGG